MQPVVLDAVTDLATDTSSQLFLGRDHGVDASMFFVHFVPGQGPRLHRHPYPEVFVIQAGEATFRVDGAEYPGRPGQVIVVPAGAAHAFRNSGSETLEVISVHPVAEMETEWLEEEGDRTPPG